MFPLDHTIISGGTLTTELPAKLTVRYILDTAGGSQEGSTEAVEDPKPFLVANGVELKEEDSEEDLKKAASALQDSVFWQKHASLHPQQGRAKNWLWIHGRYRNQADAMLAESDPAKQMAAFQKFHKKIESHSEFEDTQLFKFFVDSKIGNQENIQELMKQHGNIRLVTEINEGLEKCCKVGSASEEETKATEEKLTKYVEDLKAHLDLEEKTIVGPWLQLTPEQYKTYRSYLSWTYCFMY